MIGKASYLLPYLRRMKDLLILSLAEHNFASPLRPSQDAIPVPLLLDLQFCYYTGKGELH